MSLAHGSVTEVCYVTHDMEAAAARWAELVGGGPFYLMPSPEMTFEGPNGEVFSGRIKAALGFSGTTLVEFIEPLVDSPAIFREVLEANGEGAMHHVMTNVAPMDAEDFDSLCRHYEQAGLPRVLKFEVPGQGRNCFYDARDRIGAFIEVLQVPDHAFDMLNLMQAAHRAPVKGRPLQDIAELFANAGH
ncbi:MAG: VOC family protein [Porticoccaceae bacterium]|jgi:hypothetical protein|nr:VOC family protein [Porticoccaceae bacterium]MEA3300221.1 VOC family protein [Pseudomonadota bacterium]HLS99563.1 VOC family protein [Porticoccaceae bacterium]